MSEDAESFRHKERCCGLWRQWYKARLAPVWLLHAAGLLALSLLASGGLRWLGMGAVVVFLAAIVLSVMRLRSAALAVEYSHGVVTVDFSAGHSHTMHIDIAVRDIALCRPTTFPWIRSLGLGVGFLADEARSTTVAVNDGAALEIVRRDGRRVVVGARRAHELADRLRRDIEQEAQRSDG